MQSSLLKDHPELSRLLHPCVLAMTEELNQEMELNAHPDIAWMWRNHRPAVVNGLLLGRWAVKTPTPFCDSEHQRVFALPADNWLALSDGLKRAFKKRAATRPWSGVELIDWKEWIEDHLDRMTQIAWTLEMLETRQPWKGDDLSPDLEVEALVMDCRGWFDVLCRWLHLAQHNCRDSERLICASSYLTLTTQGHPSNDRFMLSVQAEEQMLLDFKHHQRIIEIKRRHGALDD